MWLRRLGGLKGVVVMRDLDDEAGFLCKPDRLFRGAPARHAVEESNAVFVLGFVCMVAMPVRSLQFSGTREIHHHLFRCRDRLI